MSSTRLGRVQLRIMQALWDKGRATARELTEVLSEAEPIAHSTVQTLLRGLEEKGAVSHFAEARTFVFVPQVNEQKFKQSATRDLVDRVFGGSVASLVAHLLKHERVSREEIEAIRQMVTRSSGKKETP